jgi:hypothetical protein
MGGTGDRVIEKRSREKSDKLKVDKHNQLVN